MNGLAQQASSKRRVCAWCRQELPGAVAGLNGGQISHGICGSCAQKYFSQGRSEVDHQIHNLEASGSSPLPASNLGHDRGNVSAHGTWVPGAQAPGAFLAWEVRYA